MYFNEKNVKKRLGDAADKDLNTEVAKSVYVIGSFEPAAQRL